VEKVWAEADQQFKISEVQSKFPFEKNKNDNSISFQFLFSFEV